MMVLLLESPRAPLSVLAELLAQSGVRAVLLSGQDLVRHVQVRDGWQGDSQDAYWHTPQGLVDLSVLDGLYCPDLSALDLSCRHVVAEDRDFVEQSWVAYLWYRLARLKNCINPVVHQRLALSCRQLPYLYQQAQACGWVTPDYHISTVRKALVKWQRGRPVVSLQCLLKPGPFVVSNVLAKQAIAALDCLEGYWVMVHVIGSWVYASYGIEQGQWRCYARLPMALQLACRRLANKLGYPIAQLLLRYTVTQKYLFYHLTPDIDWSHCAVEESTRWLAVIQLLLPGLGQALRPRPIPFSTDIGGLMPPAVTPNDALQRSYIDQSLRPTLPGEEV